MIKHCVIVACLLALLAALACDREQPLPPAPAATTAAVQPAPTAMESTAAPTATEATAMDNQGVSRLDVVRNRGALVCASSDVIPGFGYLADGANAGFDIDLCRAVAAAVLGDPGAVEIRSSIPTGLGVAIQSGEIDMAARVITASTTREAGWGNFVHTMFYDGQGFIVRRSLGIGSARELEGTSVCVTENTTTKLNLEDFSKLHDTSIRIVAHERTSIAVDTYLNGQCDAFTTDHSGLYAYLSTFPNPDEHLVLPDVISEEPLTPMVPHGDDQWFDIVKTVMAILIYAEAYGVTSGNVPTATTGDTRVDRLFGLEGSFGQEALGLPDTVAQDVIRGVGNYGEIYDRHLIPLGLERAGSRNALWANAPCTDCPRGGQIYAAPLR